jgi:hypothetical protein
MKNLTLLAVFLSLPISATAARTQGPIRRPNSTILRRAPR